MVMRFRSSLKLVCTALAVLLAGFHYCERRQRALQTIPRLFRHYTGTKSQGIYVSRLDTASGKLSAPTLAAQSVNPSFVAIDPNHRFLFAVNETEQFNGQASGAVTAFRLDAATGKLEFLNQQPSGGTGPCHIVVDSTGKYVLVANYSSGSVAVFPVQTNGFIGPPTAVIQHHGSSVNPQRQAGPHAHCVAVDAATHRVFACDLGLDKVMIYRLNETNGTLTPDENPWAEVKPGSGPRHIAFRPDGRHAYVINEMGSTLTVFDYDPEHGALKEMQTVSTLPEDFHGKNTSPRWPSIPPANLSTPQTGVMTALPCLPWMSQAAGLKFVERQSTRGKIPRCFAIDPTGQYLIAANQDSDSVVVFRINAQTGQLTWTGQTLEVGKPVCVAFVQWRPQRPDGGKFVIRVSLLLRPDPHRV